jgi:phospholipid/cholesterol/gamma-HCH transport system substrate-binding protein
MSPNKRNVLVGVVVLTALGVMAWMVLKFANRASEFFLTKGSRIQVVADRADGLSEGSAIYYRGVSVGRVLGVRLDQDNRVVIDAIVEPGRPVPVNVEGFIRTGNLLSATASIFLEPIPGQASSRNLQAGDVLHATIPRGSAIIPEEFTGLARSIQDQELVKHLDETVITVRAQAERAGKLMESINSLVSDEKMRGDLRTAMSNVRQATEQANQIAAKLDRFSSDLNDLSKQSSQTIADVRAVVNRGGEHMDQTVKNINSRIDQVGKLLEQFQSIAARVDKGEGTVGLLVRDPKLYESLVATADTLKLMMADLRRLVQQWEQEGLSFKLSK